eukprot:1626987-Amphidinium_carterae.1
MENNRAYKNLETITWRYLMVCEPNWHMQLHVLTRTRAKLACQEGLRVVAKLFASLGYYH